MKTVDYETENFRILYCLYLFGRMSVFDDATQVDKSKKKSDSQTCKEKFEIYKNVRQ